MIIIESLGMQRLRAMDGSEKCAVFLTNLSPLYHIYIVKSLFTNRDDELENLGETIVLACKMRDHCVAVRGSKMLHALSSLLL